MSLAPEKHEESEAMAKELELETPSSPRKVLDACPDYGKPWWRVPHILRLNTYLLIVLISPYVAGFDGSMLNGMQSVQAWQEFFNHPQGAVLGVLSAMQVIGGVFALPVVPLLADRLGRRPPIFIGSVILIIGSALQGAAVNFGMFITGRGLVGLGGGFIAVTAPALVAELAYPTQRPTITAIYNTTWSLGAIVAAWVTYGTFAIPNDWSWRIPCLLQSLGSIIQAGGIFFVPESPRYLVSQDRLEDAEKVLSKWHAGSDEPNELVRLEMAEIQEALHDERNQRSAGYMHFFKTAGNRHRFFICLSLGFIIQWCGNGLISYYLVPVLKSVGITAPKIQNLINGILQIVNWLTALSSAFFVERVGRRKLFLFSTGGMVLAFIIWTALSAEAQKSRFQNKGLGVGVVIMIFVFFVFYNIGMQPVPVAYLLEVLPFTLRAKGFTLFKVGQYASLIFNAFINPIALQQIQWRYYIVFCCLVACWFALFYFFFPETKGLSLEKVAIIFDGEECSDGDERVAKEKKGRALSRPFDQPSDEH